MAGGFARVTFVWEDPAIGTPPFTTGLWLQRSSTPSPADNFQALAIIRGAWDDNLVPACNSGLGAGRLDLVWQEPTEVLTASSEIDNAGGGGQTRGAGYSFRARLLASRPAGARDNCQYFPMPDTTYYGVSGATAGGIGDIFSAYGSDIIGGLDDTDWTWVARHYIDSDGHDESVAPVTGVDLANTVSFLRKRYR